ncbi:molybdopterin-dependent oxidoreductase [uncultured Roseovarius sp.]|uniref:molybdopterin-dependent oxidoreductase n=1 Tax=uncultured Roseovarius sp. TaxID=293344 RepID=UPI00262C48D8|nr:molybdopterin-dependent oxidoreductase [uncultured Roseovarius sp.]
MSGKSYTGTHFGVFEVVEAEGAGVTLRAPEFERDPTPIMASFVELVTSPLRIKKPAVRAGYLENGAKSKAARGDEPFVEVSWDTALDLAADALGQVYKDHGAASVFGGSYGWASAGRFHHSLSQVHRFLNTVGGYTASVNTYSHAAAEVLLPHIVGAEDDIIYSGTTWPVIRDNTDVIVAFGGLPSVTGQVSPGGVSAHTNADWIKACGEAGVKLITIGPTQSHVDGVMDSHWISPRPCTDTALMLGLAYHLVQTDRHDRDFLDRYAVGFDRFLPYLMGDADGTPKTPEWAAGICDLDTQTIRDLAEQLTAGRTLLTATWALQRAEKGEQPFWMLIVLAAMVGQIGLPGGGFAFGLSSFNGVANPVHRRRYASVPQGSNPIRQRIPVARVTEMLENPGGQIDFNGQIITFPDIRAVYWAGGNPFHHHQDLHRLRQAWRNPDVVIVNELEWNAMARHADIVFPVASTMERNDVMAPNSDRRLIAMKKCAEPVGDSRTDYDIFSGLAARMGTLKRYTEGRNEDDWLRHMYAQSQERFAKMGVTLPDFETFWEQGSFEHCPEDVERVLLQDFRDDPKAHPLPTPSGRIEIYSETIARFNYDDCPGHPMWLPPHDWLGSKRAEEFPLHLMSPQPRSRIHGQLDGNGASAASKIKGREPGYLNQQEANRRGIQDGDIIRVFNDTGSLLCAAKVVDWVADHVLVLPTGAWYAPMDGDAKTCVHGNPNVLTADVGTSRLGQGPSPNSTLVQAERFDGPLPEISVHMPPEFVAQTGREK